VTAPLHKEALHAAGVDYPGHTELLQAEAAAHVGVGLAQMPVRMMLANHELRTVLVSIHVSLRQAIEAVTFDNVLQTLRITHDALTRMLGRAPRIGVAGLNPHAGEGGLFGQEELTIIAPAVAAARAEQIDAQGPFAPDTIFMRARDVDARAGEFDVVLAMYHDQGLIPVKYLGVEQGVNVTLGLPLVRTARTMAQPSILRARAWPMPPACWKPCAWHSACRRPRRAERHRPQLAVRPVGGGRRNRRTSGGWISGAAGRGFRAAAAPLPG